MLLANDIPFIAETGEEMDMEEREENLATRKVRIYVGGLGEGVTRDDICVEHFVKWVLRSKRWTLSGPKAAVLPI